MDMCSSSIGTCFPCVFPFPSTPPPVRLYFDDYQILIPHIIPPPMHFSTVHICPPKDKCVRSHAELFTFTILQLLLLTNSENQISLLQKSDIEDTIHHFNFDTKHTILLSINPSDEKLHIRSHNLAQEVSINPSKQTTDGAQGKALRMKGQGNNT